MFRTKIVIPRDLGVTYPEQRDALTADVEHLNLVYWGIAPVTTESGEGIEIEIQTVQLYNVVQALTNHGWWYD